MDYILMLVQKVRDAKGDGDDDDDDKEARAAIERAIDSSPSLRNKKDLIEEFVDSVSNQSVAQGWRAFIAVKREQELERIIADENLKSIETHEFVERAFRDAVIHSTGTAVTRILPAVSRFAKGGGHGAKKQVVLEEAA